MPLYPPIEPHQQGFLETADGQRIYWEVSGNPFGKPAVVLHGGPGSGAVPRWRQYFDPACYRIVLFDQRGCGRSTPPASEHATSLATNTTHHLVADIEALRELLAIDQWLVFGGSWGTTLALAYAEAHPSRVSGMVLFSVTNTTRREVEWVTQDVRRIFPAEWERFASAVPPGLRDLRPVDAYARLLNDESPAVREQAAIDWCTWEDAHVSVLPGHQPDPRYLDPVFRLGFARLVTHYWSNHAFLEEGALLRDVDRIAHIPALLAHGRMDVSSPLDVAYDLAQRWPSAELVIVDDAGHGAGYPSLRETIIAATDRFAVR